MNDLNLEFLSTCILCDSKEVANACQQNRFCRCLECGHVFDNPRPTQASIIHYYSKAEKYDEWLAQKQERRALHGRRLRRILKNANTGRLLDIGAGIGEFLHLARDHFEVSGTEISSSAVALSNELHQVPLREGIFETLDFPARFDVITLIHVLEHVPFPQQTLNKCEKWLNPGGVLVVAVPNDIDCYWSRRNRLGKKWGLKKYQALGDIGLPALTLDMAEIHLSHFRLDVLKKNLEGRGFEIVDSGLDPYFAATGMRKLRRFLRYFAYWLVFKITGKNLYETLWITAQKPVVSASSLKNNPAPKGP